MKAETETLLQACRAGLLQQSNEHIATLLARCFEFMIGEDYLDEERDDLCLLLGYRVQSQGSQVSYTTYTSWWEVEGYLEPSAGTFTCADVASLRQRLLDMPIKQFDVIVEMAHRMRTFIAQTEGQRSLPGGWELLREMARWFASVDPAAGCVGVRPSFSVQASAYFESEAQRRRREQALVEQAVQQGYLVRSPDSSREVTEAFRRWCREHKQPYIMIEPHGSEQAIVHLQSKTAGVHETHPLLPLLRDKLPTLAAPYLAHARAQGYAATLDWLSRQHVALQNILIEDVQAAARELVKLWSVLITKAQQRAAEEQARREAARVPMWKRDIQRWKDLGTPLEVPILPAEVVLPATWPEQLTREHLAAFLNFLSMPATSRETKPVLVQRVQERLDDASARALFFEIFKRELAVPPWELETLLACTPTERKRWTSEEKLPVLEQRDLHKHGRQLTYPVFDRRIILALTPADLERWRAEHQALLKERRRAAAARKKQALVEQAAGNEKA